MLKEPGQQGRDRKIENLNRLSRTRSLSLPVPHYSYLIPGHTK